MNKKAPLSHRVADLISLGANLILKGSIAPFDRLGVGQLSGIANGAKLEEPYRNSVFVQRAVKKVAGPICAVNLHFFADARGGQQLITDPAWTEFWKAPARGSQRGKLLSRAETFEATVSWLKMEGEAFWLMESTPLPFPEVAPKGGLRPFIIARPDRMRTIIDRFTGELLWWEFTDGAGRRVLLPPEQVVQFKCFNPYSEYRGLPEYDAARQAAEADYLAGKFNLNLMRNNGDTGPIVIGKNGVPDDAQREQITSLLRQKKEMSLRGENRPVFLAGDITVEDPQVKTPDANFVNIRTQDRYEIFLAFGVPPSMADKMTSYSVGSASDWYMLITETCMPTGEKVCAGVEEFMSRAVGRPVYADLGWDQHPVMQAVRRERIDAGVKLWSCGMPWAKASEYLDLKLPEFPGWETGYLPFSVSAVGEDGQVVEPDPVSDPNLAEEDEEQEGTEDPVKEMVRALRQAVPGPTHSRSPITNSQAGAQCGCGTEGNEGNEVFQRARDPKEVAQWRTLIAKRRTATKVYQSKFNKVLFTARAEVLSKLTKAQGKNSQSPIANSQPSTRAVAADFLFDLKAFKARLLAELRAAALDTLNRAGQELLEELGKDDPWKMADPKALEFLRNRENKLTDVAEDVFSQIKGELEEGLNSGESTAALADRVRSTFNGMSKERSMRVAMTETNAAYGTARQEAMRDAGVEFKKWLTSGNANVRAAHQAANQQVVRTDEPFEVGGEYLMHPGDPHGSPENVINCHCVSIATAGADE